MDIEYKYRIPNKFLSENWLYKTLCVTLIFYLHKTRMVLALLNIFEAIVLWAETSKNITWAALSYFQDFPLFCEKFNQHIWRKETRNRLGRYSTFVQFVVSRWNYQVYKNVLIHLFEVQYILVSNINVQDQKWSKVTKA